MLGRFIVFEISDRPIIPERLFLWGCTCRAPRELYSTNDFAHFHAVILSALDNFRAKANCIRRQVRSCIFCFSAASCEMQSSANPNRQFCFSDWPSHESKPSHFGAGQNRTDGKFVLCLVVITKENEKKICIYVYIYTH